MSMHMQMIYVTLQGLTSDGLYGGKETQCMWGVGGCVGKKQASAADSQKLSAETGHLSGIYLLSAIGNIALTIP